MVCFTIWLEPTCSFYAAAKTVGKIFSIDLEKHPTTKYDEYPAYKVECENISNTFVRIFGVPRGLDQLIADFPYEYGEKDNNYCVMICADEIPKTWDEKPFLSYKYSSEMAYDLIKKFKEAGFSIYEKMPPRIRENNEIKEYPI